MKDLTKDFGGWLFRVQNRGKLRAAFGHFMDAADVAN